MSDKRDWWRRGYVAQARYEGAKLRLSMWADKLRAKRLELEYRYVAWKVEKLETLTELAESKAYQNGWEDE